MLAFYYITRAYTLNDKFSLFIGVGFLANALIDLLHVVVSLSLTNEPLFLKYFIPQTWFAGRIFLSAMLAIAIAGYPKFSMEVPPPHQSQEGTNNNVKQKGYIDQTYRLPHRYLQRKRQEGLGKN